MKKKNIFIGIILMIITISLGVFLTLNNKSYAVSTPGESVFIKSSGWTTNSPGSFQVEKSAEWIKSGIGRINFDLETRRKEKQQSNYLDVVMILDISGSMYGDKLRRVQEDSIELINSILSDTNNKIGLVTFHSNATKISNLTNDKQTLLNHVNGLSVTGCTNYNDALKKGREVLEGYVKQNNRDLVMLFLTDGYPNEDVPNQIGTYQTIKEEYPYITVNGIQYEMGDSILNPIKEISDYQYLANMETLNNVLFEATITPLPFDKIELIDYIDDTYFDVESVQDIKASVGTVTLDGNKVTWTIENLLSGSKANLTIDIKLKDEYKTSSISLFPTNKSTSIETKIGEDEETKTTTDTPVLPSPKRVIYDGNFPSSCQSQPVLETESYLPTTTVSISDFNVSCNGWNINGFKIVEDDVEVIGKDAFIMPDHDVHIKAIWGKLTITKSMDGTVKEDNTLAGLVRRICSEEGYAEGQGNGVYATNSYVEDGETLYHACRYVGGNPNNYVLFNDDMYQIIGVFDDDSHGKTGEDLVKLISANIMIDTTYGVYNTDNTSGTYSGYSNNWTGTGQTTPSNSHILLNEYFLKRKTTSDTYGDCNDWTYTNSSNIQKTKSCNTLVGYGIKDTYRAYIEDVTWYLYGYSGSNLSKENFYKCERGQYSGCTSGNSGANDATTNTKIGLLYPSDYLYASGYVGSNATTNGSSQNFVNMNWIHKGYEWTITPRTSNADGAFVVYNEGSVVIFDTSGGVGVRPTFYLKSRVYVTGGNGTFDNPYRISM